MSSPREILGQLVERLVAKLDGPESAIAMLRFRSEKMGRTVPPDIVIGNTPGEKKLRAEAEAWLGQG